MKSTIVSAVSLLLAAVVANAQSQGLEISPLGPRGSIIKVNSDQKYILFPVQESASDVGVKVMVNTELERTINVKIARDSVDYYVPYDLSGYNGKALSFVVRQNAAPRMAPGTNRGPQVAPKDFMLDKITLSNTFDTTNREVYRHQYHFTPAYGWMNDPNGMVYKDGEWHLFYQYNPYASVWGNMHWGHAVSKDLVNWEHLPVAIFPDGVGSVFSGSCVVDENNTAGFGKGAIIAIYTSSGDAQVQSIAYSNDNGRTFKKYNGNPVLTSDQSDFRDPKVFWDEHTSKWVMILAAGNEVRFYSSDNLKQWKYESSFGSEYGNHGGVFECPDILKLPVEGTNTSKYLVIVNINPGGPSGGSATQYFVGDFDGHKFTCDSPKEMTKWMDFGKDHYATVSFSNAPQGRSVVMAWMSNWQYANAVPTRQYRSSNSVPRDLSLYSKDGELYVKVTPSAELDALRGVKTSKSVGSVSKKKEFKNILASYDDVFEMEVSFTPSKKAQSFSVEFCNDKNEKVVMTYDFTKSEFVMDRTESGIVSFSPDFPAATPAPVVPAKKYTLHLYVDKCSIEAFDADGKTAVTNLVYPTEAYKHVSFSAQGGSVSVDKMIIYSQNN